MLSIDHQSGMLQYRNSNYGQENFSLSLGLLNCVLAAKFAHKIARKMAGTLFKTQDVEYKLWLQLIIAPLNHKTHQAMRKTRSSVMNGITVLVKCLHVQYSVPCRVRKLVN